MKQPDQIEFSDEFIGAIIACKERHGMTPDEAIESTVRTLEYLEFKQHFEAEKRLFSDLLGPDQ